MCSGTTSAGSSTRPSGNSGKRSIVSPIVTSLVRTDDRPRLVQARSAPARSPGAASGARPSTTGGARLLPRRPPAPRPPRLRPPHPVPARVPGRSARALTVPGDPARAARARRCPRWPGGAGRRRCTSAADVGPVRAPADRARDRRGRRRVLRAPGAARGGRSRCGADPGRQALQGVQPVPPLLARSAAPGGDRAATGGSLPAGVREGGCRSLGRLGLEQEVSEPLPGGEGAGRKRMHVLGHGRASTTTTTTTRSAPTRRRGCRPTCTSAASRRARWSAAPARRGCGGLPAPALLARLLPPRAAPLPAQRAGRSSRTRYRGAIRWSYAETALRGVGAGTHRLPARRRRDAPAAAARDGCTTGRGWWSGRS